MKNTTHTRLSFLTNLLVLLALVSGMFLSTQPATAATTITVNSTSDQINSSDNLCTLREAIIAANRDAVSGRLARECQAGSGADTIIIPAGVYNLTRTDNGREDASATGDLDITSNVTLEAKGGSVLIQGISGFTDRIFHILRGTVSLSGLTIKGGKVTGDGGGDLYRWQFKHGKCNPEREHRQWEWRRALPRRRLNNTDLRNNSE